MHRHRFDPISFVFGLIFLGLGLTAVVSDEDIAFLEARWIWPALLVTAGLVIVGFTARRSRGDEELEPDPYNPVG